MTYFEGDNIGSILKLEYCLHTGFSSFNPVVLSPGVSWTEIPVKDESCALFLKVTSTLQGTTYTYSGPFRIHHMRDEIDNALFPLVGKKLVLRLTDMNHRVYIIGSPGVPVHLEADSKTGERYIEENGYSFQFEVTQTNPAFAL